MSLKVREKHSFLVDLILKSKKFFIFFVLINMQMKLNINPAIQESIENSHNLHQLLLASH